MTATDDEVGDLHLATVVVNVQDMQRAVAFWSAALGYRPREPEWNSEFMMLEHPQRTRPPLSLQLTDQAPAQPVRVHVDLYTDEQQRHVERLVGLGASRVEDWPYPDECDFVVLRDPDGNEFCVIDHVDLQLPQPAEPVAHDPDLHEPGSTAAAGGCSHHEEEGDAQGRCTGEAVVSYQDSRGRWQSCCQQALEELVAQGRLAAFGQGA
jgi:catechol 2,3-dioxygenase-like lactoylglutathione lyase family enzyme